MNLKPALTPVLAMLCCACASKPYAMIDGTRSSRTDATESEVRIVAIDGRFMRPRGTMNLEPGSHELLIVTTRSDRRGAHAAQAFELTAQPCMRYVLAARHHTSIDRENWDLVLKAIEPIPWCELPQEPQSAQAMVK